MTLNTITPKSAHSQTQTDNSLNNYKNNSQTAPLCPYFGKCGGCSAQHIPYDVQTKNKQKLTAVATGVHQDHVEIHTGEPYHYRNRMDLIVHENGLGFRKEGRFQDIVNIDQCPIANKRLNELITEVKSFLIQNSPSNKIDAFNHQKLCGTFKYVVIRTPTKTSSISFVLNTQSTKIDETTKLTEKFAKQTSADSILVAYVDKERDIALSDDFITLKGSDMIKENMLDKELIYSTQAFFQNNSHMANEMVKYVREIIAQIPDHQTYKLLDLYGGVGTFGICVSDLVKSTHIVECVQQAIDAANLNIKHNNVQNTTAQVLDAGNLKRLAVDPVGKTKIANPLIVITDPPRSGMDQKTIECLNKIIMPNWLIYISCNPHQLEKELPRLTNYNIERVAMFDLFPQTNHAEAVIILRKK